MKWKVIYSEIKVKNFRKESTMHKFLYGKKSPVNHLLSVNKNINGVWRGLDLVNELPNIPKKLSESDSN